MNSTFDDLIFPIREALLRVEKNCGKTLKIHVSPAFKQVLFDALEEVGALQDADPAEAPKSTEILLGYEAVTDSVPEGDWWLETDEVVLISVIHKLKHVLEFGLKKNPNIDYSREWMELMRAYRKHNSKANEAYCRKMAGLPPMETTSQAVQDSADMMGDEQPPDFDWQYRTDIE